MVVNIRGGPSGPYVAIPNPAQPFDWAEFFGHGHGEVPYAEGTLWYDTEHHCFSVYDDSTNSVLEIGQETRIRIVNKTGGILTDTTAVYVSGVQGNRPIAWPAIASDAAKENLAGIITHDIADNQEGWMTIIGVVNGYNTSGFTESDRLWLSTTVLGALQNTLPTGTDFVQLAGIALNSTPNGSILVNMNKPGKLANLTDVDTADPSVAGRILAANGTHWSEQTALMLEGSGSPEGVIAAPLGSLFRNLSGGAGTTLYVKETGAATNTGWAAK